jgi:hypothetical protein
MAKKRCPNKTPHRKESPDRFDMSLHEHKNDTKLWLLYFGGNRTMSHKLPKSVYDAKIESLWRHSRRFIAYGLRMKSSPKAIRHYTGGAAPHKGNKCPQCKKCLTLLWDLDLHDELIPDYVNRGFSPAQRLPLYVCWQCLAASYAVLSDRQIKCFPFDLHTEYLQKDETPFRADLVEIPRRPIAFDSIPSTVDAILSLADMIGHDALDKSARKTLNTYFGKRTEPWDYPMSQFGGQPLVYQDHQNKVCPNPKCPANKLSHPYADSEIAYLMKEMALIHWTDEPVLEEHCFQLLYSICGICFSIRAEYRCD